jgi:micrococcal nuclease
MITTPAGGDLEGRVRAKVARIVDGDTIEVDLASGGRATLRYIGMDTPETVAPGEPVGCYGKEASERNKNLVDGKTVFLEKDVSEADRFGRLLRYVYLEDGRMVNQILVHEGYAQVATFPPDVKYQQTFLDEQRQARDASRGLWGACLTTTTSSTTNRTTSNPMTVTTAPSGPTGNCDPAYPTVCIPRYPPDLDCKDIPFKRFKVLPPDPHKFDADNDGLGCES